VGFPGSTLHETLWVDDHPALRAQVPAGLAADVPCSAAGAMTWARKRSAKVA